MTSRLMEGQVDDSASTYPAPNVTLGSEGGYAALILHHGDRIRLIDFPEDVHAVVCETVNSHWPGGVQSKKTMGNLKNTREMKLKGYPWAGVVLGYEPNQQPATPTKLVNRLLENLFNVGWEFKIRTSLSKINQDEEVLMFRCGGPWQRCEWAAIDTHFEDGLLLINTPAHLAQAIREILHVQKEAHNPPPGYYGFKIRGYPWTHGNRTGENGTRLALRILEVAEEQGWFLYASVKQGATDAWHFCRVIPEDPQPLVDIPEPENPFEATAENIIHEEDAVSDAITPHSLLN
ncbi:Uu.00g080660.m01.CDS01 [Anthostomella pinea]|uniref:Uu.00g080660.m01.CDS01 n=1 Tax=Anthostomella pinea TaxID=933095 RepID=A0AAI8VM67_9PEZI|nr:Uu.00g080660.m01.CDS01 [Anthostomella pinea]